MSSPADQNAKPPTPEIGATRKALLDENEVLKARLAELEAEAAAQRARFDASWQEREAAFAASAPAASPGAALADAWVLKRKLRHNGVDYAVGDFMPFDPTKPPKGCEGLVEGQNYERARVIVRDR